jgi:Subtilase family
MPRDTPARSMSAHAEARHPRPSQRRLACVWQAAAIAAACLPFLPAPTSQAWAETPITAQARADYGVWLDYAPAPPARAGLCLVDTGVNVNPDTETAVVLRTAIDGGTGDDASPSLHGTTLAMLAVGPANEWGALGTAPGAAQIVSVRILEPGQATFPFSAYAAGITLCLQLRRQYDIRVINLSLGSPSTPSSQELTTIVNAVQRANDYGLAVLAAAGNDDGGTVEYPAAAPGVLAVAASDTSSGALCSFSNHGEGLQMIAPGCGLDAADPVSGASNYNYTQGTSQASLITSTALTALLAYRPDLSYRAAEEDLTNPSHGALDITAAFRAAGLTDTIAAGEASEPQPTQPPLQPSTPQASPNIVDPSNTATQPLQQTSMSPRGLPRPRARLAIRSNRLVLELADRPNGTRTQIHVLGRVPGSPRLRLLGSMTSSRATLTLSSRGVAEVKVRYTDPQHTRRSSAWVTLHPPNPAQRAPSSLP